MKINRRVVLGALGAGAVIAGGTGVAVASGSGDDDGTDVPITGNALTKASEVALGATGGGKVTETEVGDEEGAYEVEVTLPDGSQTDVHLDERFQLLGRLADNEKDGDSSG